MAVPIPEYVLQTKMYGQTSVGDIRRAIFDTQQQRPQREPRRRRSRALFAQDDQDNESMNLDTPARKLSRQMTAGGEDDLLENMSIQSSPLNMPREMNHNNNSQSFMVGYYQQDPSTSLYPPKPTRQNPLMMFDFMSRNQQQDSRSMTFPMNNRNIPRVPQMNPIGYQMQNVLNETNGK